MRHTILPKTAMMCLIFLLFWRFFMDRIKMTAKMDKTFEEGFEEYKSEKLNISKLARVCGISRTTIYKYLEVLKK